MDPKVLRASQGRDANHRQDLLQVEGHRITDVPTDPDPAEDRNKGTPRLLQRDPFLLRSDPPGTGLAIKSKTITKSTTNRDARDLVKRIRFPVERVEEPKHDTTWRTILTINENPSAPLTPDDLLRSSRR